MLLALASATVQQGPEVAAGVGYLCCKKPHCGITALLRQ